MSSDERVAASAVFYFINLLTTKAQKDPWLARLVRTRRLVAVPLPCASAYGKNARFDEIDGEQVDPVGDFPFARSHDEDKACLRSSVAQVMDALFAK